MTANYLMTWVPSEASHRDYLLPPQLLCLRTQASTAPQLPGVCVCGVGGGEYQVFRATHVLLHLTLSN